MNKTSTAITGRCCPHCGNNLNNLTKLVFTKGAYNCPRCGYTTHLDKMRLIEEYVTPAHWSARMPVVNLDKMTYRAPNPGCIFDHRKERAVDTETGLAPTHDPLKVYKRG